MQVQIHNVKKITSKLIIFDGFNTLTLTVTDDNGTETEFKLYSDDLEKLSIIWEAVRIAYDK